ncbi:MAG TPA: YbaB/EbfC family nucleoid-associated protein [Candidatus Cloacimonadota bacterium]|nr:YbaB/EbfC family nucleoid-associated protein [Candidatus Cloacimonadota bacterium]HOV16466.1 YbaB/EbfC family nucleoid-associated protein [Candidatus Cloacimonadota bacterium]HQL14966.1 YbaB/EbfC family nucleoid-associated protein [Candidatus Cloacimonadota bacterium]
MFPGGKNMKELMKQAQKMQQEMLKQQEELENQIFEASSGGGMVTVQINGKFEVQSVKIDPQAIDPDDVEMLEDLIVAALQEAHKKASEAVNNVMGKFTGGLNIPGFN